MSRQVGDTPTRTFNPGDVIFREGDDAKGEAFIVHSGKVEIRLRVEGEEQLVTVLGKGELLGGYAFFRKAPRSATAIAAEPVTLMVLPANRLEHMVRSNPLLAMAIVRDLITRLLATEERAQKAEARRALDPAISLLRERYARSEITKEEFDAKLRALGGAG